MRGRMNEAAARVKIDRLLEAAGWRFFPEGGKPANIQLEQGVTIGKPALDALGSDFEKAARGFVDFLLLDERGFPLLVLEAKSEDKNPLVGKEQARRYARAQDCRFVILSNGNLHYFWDLKRGNPHIITSFPTPDSVLGYRKVEPDPHRLAAEQVDSDYIVLTQRPGYASDAAFQNEDERPGYIRAHNLRFLRSYQIRAVRALQEAAAKGKDRWLFEMATGTGKTLTAAAVIKLFLRSGNARRVLFLVDRLELEEQARKVFDSLLSADFRTVVYKERRRDWRSAEIVVSTVQSLQFDNKYRAIFSPTDFDLVISDEAHRSIGGNARAVFDYFVGYKLGLTATPRDYLKGIDGLSQHVLRDPRERERRLLRDTYRTFGCESGEPTFRYSLLDGVRDDILINPTVVDARTNVTTQLLSEKGFFVDLTDDDDKDGAEGERAQGVVFTRRQFERDFISDPTNAVFCKTFLEHALRDPVTGEIGKSIVFAVSQEHAAKLTQALNEMADRMFPGKYQSDFAVQVTSHIQDAQQMTVQFANNNLNGRSLFDDAYRTSKARVCVTVGMMSTGYDCPDILNIGLFRPIFSPTDFVQIKGRGTRPHDFTSDLLDRTLADRVLAPRKTAFKLFDFFGNCEYFETEFNYDQKIELPRGKFEGETQGGSDDDAGVQLGYEQTDPDRVVSIEEGKVGPEGMKIDRMFFDRFADTVQGADHQELEEFIKAGQWDNAIDYVNCKVFEKPEDYFNLTKLRKSADVDRRLTLREILEKIFGLIPRFKSKDELLEEEFTKFVADYKPAPAAVTAVKTYFKAYAIDGSLRDIIDERRFAKLATNPGFSIDDYRAVPKKYRELVPEYVKDYVSLNQFAA